MGGFKLTEKYKELELVAYGCNRRINNELERFLNEQDIQSFTFYEFFCDKPILIERAIPISETESEMKLLCPFVKRYVMGSPLLPTSSKIQEGQNAVFTSRLIRDKENLSSFYEPLEIRIKDPASDSKKVLSGWGKKNGECQVHIEHKDENNFIRYLASAEEPQKKEFAIVDVCWLDYLISNEDTSVAFLYTPIASKSYFYGELLLIIEDKKINVDLAIRGITKDDAKKQKEDEIKIRKRAIEEKLAQISRDDYLPLLVIFENYWQEQILKDEIEKGNPPINNPFARAESDIEKALSGIWEWRKSKNLNNGNDKKAIKDSLIMTKYIVASPGMIDKVKKAITIDLRDSCKPPIPCILIVGGPGSGKENMAKLIAKYSKEFRDAKIFTINMASLKPKELAGPLLSGIPFIEDYEGLLQRIIMNNDLAVIIFDELNSLDIDSQGTLLRLIENREFCKKGIQEEIPPKNKILIIGLMNEDPDRLTKLSTIQNINREEKIFGGLIGEIMYEYVRRLRRLREDLYDRMKRNAVINIPELENRIEDLPFLFYVFLKDELKEMIGEEQTKAKKIIIEYEAFEVLMDKSIKWMGNVRQLQTVAKNAVKKLNISEERIFIDRHLIRQILKENHLLSKGLN